MKQTKLQMTGSFFGVNSCYAALDVTIAWDQALEWGERREKTGKANAWLAFLASFFGLFPPNLGT